MVSKYEWSTYPVFSMIYVEKTVTQENQFLKSSTKVHQKVQQFLRNSLISSLLSNSNYYEKSKI